MSWNMAAEYNRSGIGSTDAEELSPKSIATPVTSRQCLVEFPRREAPHRGEPFGQAVLGDAVGDLAACFFRAVDVEGSPSVTAVIIEAMAVAAVFDGVVRLWRVAGWGRRASSADRPGLAGAGSC